MDKTQLAHAVYNTCYITGEFTLRSGEKSTYYFDKYRFESDPKLLKAVAQLLAPQIPAGIEALAGLEMGGIPIATALSLETGLPAVFVRKTAKEYGTCQFAEGQGIKGKKLLVIEDVVTSGGQLIQSTKDLRGTGAIIDSAMCAILRKDQSAELLKAEHQIELISAFTMADFPKAD